jgi:hypothetical protein
VRSHLRIFLKINGEIAMELGAESIGAILLLG